MVNKGQQGLRSFLFFPPYLFNQNKSVAPTFSGNMSRDNVNQASSFLSSISLTLVRLTPGKRLHRDSRTLQIGTFQLFIRFFQRLPM